jgi:geranylgeranyl pyrophosphate synthase
MSRAIRDPGSASRYGRTSRVGLTAVRKAVHPSLRSWRRRASTTGIVSALLSVRPSYPSRGVTIARRVPCTLLYLGADLFDSIMDHELPPEWHVRDPSEASLAATTLLGALPQLSIARLQEQGTPPERLWTLAHLFADAGLTMGAGQYEALLFPNLQNVSLRDSRAMAEHKSGAEYALFATAGAALATKDSSTIEAYATFGSCFGIAQQLINDAQDIWGEKGGQDLSNAKRTFPLVHALSTLRGDGHDRLQELLAAARESTEHHYGVLALLAAAGSPHFTALMVWLYQQQVRSHLASASPREPARSELYTLLDQASILPWPRVVQSSDKSVRVTNL